MTWSIPEEATSYGFVLEGLGAHSSRTIMFKELGLLLAACPPTADKKDYRAAIVEDNVLLKQTVSTRRESFRRLREMYGLDIELLVFRAFRDLWNQTLEARPLLTLLCATTRDPMLRASAQVVLDAPVGSQVTSQMISRSIDDQYPGRLNSTTLANIGRHAASSWTQTGHLDGRSNKVRVRAQSYPTTVAYGLLLGHLCDARGEALFHTPWAKILDTPVHALKEQAALASRQGWLEYRQSGAVTEITFDYLLREVDEREPRT